GPLAVAPTSAGPTPTSPGGRADAASRCETPRRGSVADRELGSSRVCTAPSPPAPGPADRDFVREWLDGLRATVRDHGLRWGLVVDGMAAVAQGIFTVLFVLF